jgi:crotonobetainyl-CoA:carnitine CoA-transferase CaiB-like acyl-CoA transferase
MGLSIVDFMTGITGMLGLVSCILGAQRSGTGGDVDVCLFDVALHQLSYPGTWYLNQGLVTGRLPRSSHPSAVPVQLYRTKDGWIFLMCMNQKFWQALIGAIGREDLGADPRFATMAARRENRDALTAVLDEILSRDTTEAWLAKLRSLLPAAPVYDMAQALDNPHVHAVGMVRNTPHPRKPELRTFANPLKFDGERPEAHVCSALGADTDEVLRAAGYSTADIASLRAAKAI